MSAAQKQPVTITHMRFAGQPFEVARVLAQAIDSERRACVAMLEGKAAAYEHNRAQARAAWRRYSDMIPKQ